MALGHYFCANRNLGCNREGWPAEAQAGLKPGLTSRWPPRGCDFIAWLVGRAQVGELKILVAHRSLPGRHAFSNL